MRTLAKVLVTTGSATAIGLLAGRARAQAVDVEPPLPNVLLLVDTSGSMEKTVAGGEPECNPLSPPSSDDGKSRWAKLVEALTGPIPDFSCVAQPRTSPEFVNEFRFNGVDPYDRNYYIPFHRLLSNGCTPGPGPTPGDLSWHLYNNPAQSCPRWAQPPSGLLDVYRDRIRFSLMTFDTLPDAGTGWLGGAPDPASGMRGMWSYFPEFQTGSAFAARGNPPDCAVADMEVGARNPAAPEWEGPLIPFPAHGAPITQVQATNERIQDAIIAMRPYGATPLAGMLSDAHYFLLTEGSTWGPDNQPLGPRDDPYISGGCRKTSIVLISDGEPNLDLRPSCAAGPGSGPGNTGCPYEEPHEIAHSLNSNINPNRRVRTFAVGFGLATEAQQQSNVDCNAITLNDFEGSGLCVNAVGPVKACCTLARIAIEGGTEHGYFPDNASELAETMDEIFGELSANSTSRTIPVFATLAAPVSTGNGADAVAYRFGASFQPRQDTSGSPSTSDNNFLWTGKLGRERFVCQAEDGRWTPRLAPFDPTKGDDFAANVNANDASRPRRFFTVIGDLDTGVQQIWSERSIRPAVTADDGLGTYTGTVTGSGRPQPASTFADELASAARALALRPEDPLPATCSGGLQTTSVETCAERIVEWETGEPMPAGIADREGNKLGSIYHATPAFMGPPNDPIPDESYRLFAEDPDVAARPPMLYAVTTDGQLHAFQVAPATPDDTLQVDTDGENNELWSFLPPHVLPHLVPTYNKQSILLDGSPVVKNVVFERTAAQAEGAGTDAGATWNTVLVASGGGGGGFYYALDVTDPLNPRFLWQLSTDRDGNELFGERTPTPAIAMVELREGTEIHEVAVAVLAGGSERLDMNVASCPRQNTTPPFYPEDTTLRVRSAVRCWGHAGEGGPVGAGRSLTIVRLDTGEVLRTFRGSTDVREVPPGLSGRTSLADFDSPITGVPVPFPSQPGQVADRIFVGDADGTLWRVSLLGPDPHLWTVDLAWDAYSFENDTAASSQPIQTTPIVSLDAFGNKVILFSTGDQEAFTERGTIETRIWSLTEKPREGSLRISENWVVPFTNGKRVTGPLSLFNGCAYFATFTPYTPTELDAHACADGYASIWGLDYQRVDPASPDDLPYGCLRYTDVPSTAPGERTEDLTPGAITFGVAVTQKPTCVDVENTTDAYFGAQTVIRQASAPEYQLVFQTGAVDEDGSPGGPANIATRTIQLPSKVVNIDSWAGIVE